MKALMTPSLIAVTNPTTASPSRAISTAWLARRSSKCRSGEGTTGQPTKKPRSWPAVIASALSVYVIKRAEDRRRSRDEQGGAGPSGHFLLLDITLLIVHRT